VANQWVTIWLEMIGTVFTLGCGVLAIWLTTPGEAPRALTSHVDAGKMGLVMSYAVLIPGLLGWLLKIYFLAEIEFIAVERVAQYCRLESEDHARTAAAQRVGGQEAVKQLTMVGVGEAEALPAAAAVDAGGVCMRYGPGEKLTLQGMAFRLREGRKAAIVGRTGAGKSSVFQLLLGFYGPEPGAELKLAGQDVVFMPTQG
jgi:ABC-type multidrug transport system fused ATPase/permease subunit